MKALLLCAWCDEKMGDTETTDGEPSHGICLPCLKARYPDLYQAFTDTTQVYDDAQPAAADTEPANE